MSYDDLTYANQFNDIAPYYDEVMSVVPYKHWVQYLRKLFKHYGWKPKSILDIATGTGSVALLLAEEGYDVTGVDLSAQMIEIARIKAAKCDDGKTVNFLCQDATQLTVTEQFDAAISLFDSFNYILPAKGLQDAFANAFAAVTSGGLFIFDLNSEYALEKNLFSQDNLWDDTASVKHVWTSTYNKRTRIATVDMQFYLPNGKAFREVHKERAHRHADVIRFLREAGFEFLDAFDEYSFLPAGRQSERIFYISRKP
ncbi:MAG TPA: class I SAM-dependent methyltransferase [Armatimonadota bacterium]|nr:class I SAM-dependent methyltransferase [Armatimonadota bacterium]